MAYGLSQLVVGSLTSGIPLQVNPLISRLVPGWQVQSKDPMLL